MTIAVEAINAAKASLMKLFDHHLPDWDDAQGRLAFIDATEQVFENLERALYAATTPEALGCVLPRPSEDGTGPSASGNDHD